MTRTEYGVFNKADTRTNAPAENLTFASRDAAERWIEGYLITDCWEVRQRTVTEWLAPRD